MMQIKAYGLNHRQQRDTEGQKNAAKPGQKSPILHPEFYPFFHHLASSGTAVESLIFLGPNE